AAPSPPTSPDDITISALFDLWNEAEKPSVPEFHVVGVALDRFVKAMGDRRLADITPMALEEFDQALATTPYQKAGQPLHKAGREATVSAIQRLLRWRDEGGPERAAHATELGRASSSE